MNTAKHKSQRTIASTVSLLILCLIMALSLAQAALADSPPGVPHQFYGTVMNNGSIVGAGYSVAARVGDTDIASTTTDGQGQYGSNEVFYVSANQGSTIYFYVDGVKAAQTATFSAGEVTELDLTVSGAPTPGSGSTSTALAISTSSLASATVGSSYSATLTASGGTSPYTWSISSGSLPAGLSLDTSGTISGTPTDTAAASLTIKVNDSASQTSSQTLSIQVNTATSAQPVTVTTSVLGQGGSFDISSGGILESATTLSSADGNVQLILNANTTVTIQGQSLNVSTEAAPPAAPSSARLVSAYNITPNDSTFSPAITLTLKYDAASLPQDVNESNLYVAFWNGSAWSEVSSTVNTQDKSVSALITHFTIFAVLGRTGDNMPPPLPTTPPAGFTIADLEILPAVANTGDQILIITAVTNNSASQGSYNVILMLNGASEAEKEVTLGPNQTKVVTFSVSKGNAGSYQVAIADKTASFTVSASAGKGGWSWPVILGLAAGAILIVVIAVILARNMGGNRRSNVKFLKSKR